jgi:hypothetical protein
MKSMAQRCYRCVGDLVFSARNVVTQQRYASQMLEKMLVNEPRVDPVES